MGLTCSKPSDVLHAPSSTHKRWKKKQSDAFRLGSSAGVPDPQVYHFLQRSVQLTQQYQQAMQQPQAESASSSSLGGQYHLLYKHQSSCNNNSTSPDDILSTGGTLRAPLQPPQEQRPPAHKKKKQPTKSHRGGKGHATATRASVPHWPSNPKAPLALYDIQFRTQLVLRRHGSRPNYEEGHSGTHIYAIRWPMKKATHSTVPEMVLLDDMDHFFWLQQQQQHSEMEACTEEEEEPQVVVPIVPSTPPRSITASTGVGVVEPANVALSTDHLFHASTMALPPKRKVVDWVTISAEHKIYVADVGLTMEECNRMVMVTEQQCRGQYAAYTYAKQTLGCREFPLLACAVQDAVHTAVAAILEHCGDASMRLALDDREPHMVKYDVTKKERQKLDMHTDKSEWTFLIAISNGAGLDYMGGGTYFECLDATVHVQRGHALIFPGRLRHCGQRIMAGLRFLLVGFLVDKTPIPTLANEPVAAAIVAENEDNDEAEDDHRPILCNVP